MRWGTLEDTTGSAPRKGEKEARVHGMGTYVTNRRGNGEREGRRPRLRIAREAQCCMRMPSSPAQPPARHRLAGCSSVQPGIA